MVGIMDAREAKEHVLEMARQHDVKFVRLWFSDILGQLKSINITVEELPEALEDGVNFDGSSIEGFARADESDMIAMPDPTTFAILPWRPQQKRVARMFCDILLPSGEPFEGDPRFVLKRNLQRAAQLGYTFYVGPELEFFYFQSADAPQALDRGGYFDMTPLDEATELRRDTVLMLEEMGIAVEHSHHEGAPSQHEIDLHYADALTMADAVMTARLVIKEVALRHGVYATFMPKPLSDFNGSGMHVNQSLFRGERNAFYDPHAPQHLSAVARAYIAGLLRHAPEISLVTNQWVNSYKRLVPGLGPLGFEAPAYVSWSFRNRADLIRVPEVRPGREQAMRIEYRAPDAACNPYLAFAAMLAAGLEGIEKEYPCPPPAEKSVYQMDEGERQALGITRLPESLWEAIQWAESSQLLRRCLGDHVFTKLIENKRMEWADYRRQVTDYEIRRYLPIL
jgi:glutamine synthetase